MLFGARPEPGTQQGTTALGSKIGRRLATIPDLLRLGLAVPLQGEGPAPGDRLVPGEACLDYIGADACDWHNCRPGTSNPWNSLEQLLNPMRLFSQGRAIKGIMVPEWASTEDPAQPDRKAQRSSVQARAVVTSR